MEASRHTLAAVQLVVDLVDQLTAGARRGRTVREPAGHELRASVARALVDRPNRALDWEAADDAEHERLRELAARWCVVLRGATGHDEAVPHAVNRLLEDAPVAPALVDHDDEPWHLHAHADDCGPADALAATGALALAELVATDGLERVGSCAAAACDRVYLDTSRNGSRRYCSGACQARAKTAAYRARRS